MKRSLLFLALILPWVDSTHAMTQAADEVVRVFLFAGQSNMVGADSSVDDIQRFPPFVGLDQPQDEVLFSYSIGRENKSESEGWVPLAPVRELVGPELSFSRAVAAELNAPIAVIKIAAGGTHLGGDWNPDEPSGFRMYPLALERVRSSLAALDERGLEYRVEGFFWHQGENDMFEESFLPAYGSNLESFIACWRRDLELPELPFFIGELCTKTVWGLDLRPRMHAISVGQRFVTQADPNAHYVPTSHVGVEIDEGLGLHYHYGTLGQLQHGLAYAEAYLERIGHPRSPREPLEPWPYEVGEKVRLFVLAGHRNMEGERAFVEHLEGLDDGAALARNRPQIAYRYDVGGGHRRSAGWEPLGPAGFSETFGPELSFAAALEAEGVGGIAIAKFTHSGSQIVDWTPAGSEATSRNLYPRLLTFVEESIAELAERGQEVELAGVLYHVAENDMSFGPSRDAAADRLGALIRQSRRDLARPGLLWIVSQQPPTDHESVDKLPVTDRIAELAAADPDLIHVRAFDLPPQDKLLVLDARGVVALGRSLAQAWLEAVSAGD